MLQSKTLIFIPTYNELENVERIFREIKSCNLGADILFLDDNSPDGTGRVIDGLVEKNENTFALHRTGKLGIGSAHKTGIEWAYEKKYEVLITMDCDFTHSPSYIINFIRHSDKADIVVGSRYMKKHSLASWNLFRKFLTKLGHFLTVNLLSMPYDASGAFRLYNLKNIDKSIFSLIQSNGYSFFFESLFILNFNRKIIFEIPIELPSRTYGTSKMTWRDALGSFRFLMSLYVRKISNKKSLTQIT
ncbi:MAG: glycosyltransferase [Bacteroidetes bacterium]|nr:MAG: glycosyltransferase [Bacteroidota bacterium]